MLLDRKANVELRSIYGWTALLWAAEEGHSEVAKLLLAKGADVHAKTDYGWTALMWAALQGKEDLVSVLLKSGSDVHEKNSQGWTALRYAKAKGFEEVAKLLKTGSTSTRSSARSSPKARATCVTKEPSIESYLGEEGQPITFWCEKKYDNERKLVRRLKTNGHPETNAEEATPIYIRKICIGKVDLNDDGLQDMLAAISSTYVCGAGGCCVSTFINERGGGWKELPQITACTAYAVLPTKNLGFHDIVEWVDSSEDDHSDPTDHGKVTWKAVSRFDGEIYQPYLKREQDPDPKKKCRDNLHVDL